MDKKVERAFELADYMTTLASQRQIIKEEYYQNLIYYYNGGLFKVTPELICFVKTLVDLDKDNNPVIVDNNDVPIDVQDLKQFLQSILSVYHSAVNEYYTKHEQLKKQRTVKSLTEL